jgi:DNA mismatch repair protein MutS
MSILLQQYKSIKAKYPDAILLFRVGDFYQSFHEDAEIVARHLGNTLTFSEQKEEGSEMASIPHYSLDTALHKLVKEGYRVAVCDQLEAPKPEPVKRGVSETHGPHRA